jgi:hypothetical protein
MTHAIVHSVCCVYVCMPLTFLQISLYPFVNCHMFFSEYTMHAMLFDLGTLNIVNVLTDYEAPHNSIFRSPLLFCVL